MSIASVVERGYGVDASIGFVVTRGYGNFGPTPGSDEKSRALREVQRVGPRAALAGLATEAEYQRVAYLTERQVRLQALADIRRQIAEAKRVEEQAEARRLRQLERRVVKARKAGEPVAQPPDPIVEAQRVKLAELVNAEVIRLKAAEVREADDLRRLEENHARIMAGIEDEEDVMLLIMASL